MDTKDIQLLFEYNTWGNHRILRAAEGLDEVRLAEGGEFPHGGLRGTLVHILGAEWIWRSRIQENISPTTPLSEQDFPTLEALRRRWEAEEQALSRFLSALSDEDLTRMVRYRNTKGAPFENPLVHLLVHLVNHGTQHRSEAAALLTRYGRSPGDLDFIMFLRQQSS